MSKAITDIDDPRLVKALAHPMRIRILAILERGVASPKQLASELNIPVENVSYHVRLLRKHGLIRLKNTSQRRGAVEHFYEMVGRPKITESAWVRLPAIVQEAFADANISQIFDLTTAAASQGKLARPDSIIARKSFMLDEEGFAELSREIVDLIDNRCIAIEKRAQERLASQRRAALSAQPIEDQHTAACFVAMLYDAPELAAPNKPLYERRRRSADQLVDNE